MDDSTRYHLLFGVSGIGFCVVGVESLLTEGFSAFSSLLAFAGVGLVVSALRQLAVRDATEHDAPGPLWLAALTALLSALSVILVLLY
jgi:hypothetical protein